MGNKRNSLKRKVSDNSQEVVKEIEEDKSGESGVESDEEVLPITNFIAYFFK